MKPHRRRPAGPRTTEDRAERRVPMLLVALALLIPACGEGTADATASPTETATTTPPSSTAAPATTTPPAGDEPTTTAPPSPTTSTKAPSPTTTSTTTTLPGLPGEPVVEALAWGLLCRDLATADRTYGEAVAYWNAEGRPARMDADENGIPCETAYPAGDVLAYWGDPLPNGLAPGPGSGWRSSSRRAPVSAACCSTNHNGPSSPPLPPESGPFPDDGPFSVRVERTEGQTDSLRLEIRRWLPCSERPDRCSPDLVPGDVYADPDHAVIRAVTLDDGLIVVIRPIGHISDGTPVENIMEGDGAAFASLLYRVDTAVRIFAEPAQRAGRDIEGEFAAIGAIDPTFPYGIAPTHGVLSYRGPENSHLTINFSTVLFGDPPSWMFDWWCTLEIVDGAPILYVWAGQIAG